MIRKLRRKMIAVTMVSVLIVLVVIMGALNIYNYMSAINDADALINIIADNNGFFPGGWRDDKMSQDGGKKPIGLSPEAPYVTRYFTVYISTEGEVVSSNIGSIAAVDSEAAAEMALSIYNEGDERGLFGNYRYYNSANSSGSMVIFLDCSKELSSFRSVLISSMIIAVCAYAAIFGLMLLISGFAVRPIAASYEKQKRFITDAGHELKTPLAVISANVEVLEIENGENEWLSSINNQVQRLSELTRSLVALSRLDEAGAMLQMTDFSLSDAVSEDIAPFVTLAERAGKSITADIEPNISFCGDERTIRQLVSILVDNAVKYSDDGGSILVSLKRGKGRDIRLECSNTVREIAIGKHPEFFERFYRADEARSSECPGYGIGLSLASSIAERHGGQISCESTDGRSVSFTLILH